MNLEEVQAILKIMGVDIDEIEVCIQASLDGPRGRITIRSVGTTPEEVYTKILNDVSYRIRMGHKI